MTTKTKEKKIPKLRFPEFKGEWEEKRLEDITKINQGLQIAISERYTVPVDNSYFYITNEFLKENSEKKYFIQNPPESVICNEKDILMTRTGNTGQVVTGVSGAFHNNFFKIDYSNNCKKWFLYYFLISHKIQHTLLKLAGTSTIPDLNHGDFYKISICLPPLPEQTKIASFLSSVDKKIQQLTRKKELLEKYKKGMMQKIFSQEVRFRPNAGLRYEASPLLSHRRASVNQDQQSQDQQSQNRQSQDRQSQDRQSQNRSLSGQPAFDTPSATQAPAGCIEATENDKEYPPWEEKRLGDVAKVYDGTHTTPDYKDSGIPFYSVEHVTSNNFNKTKYISESVYEAENKRVKLEKDDILMTRIGNIGSSVLLDWQVKASFYVSLALIKQSNLYNSKYLNQFLKTVYFQRDIHSRTIHAAFPKKINLGEISKCFILLPSIPEQQKIASFLSAIDEKIGTIRAQLDKTRKFKKGLLQQMFV